VQLSVFPASRFPFELRAEVGDSRSSGETLINDYRTLRVSVSQAYRPQTGNDNYALNFDHSRVRGSDGASRFARPAAGPAVEAVDRPLAGVGFALEQQHTQRHDDRSRQTSSSPCAMPGSRRRRSAPRRWPAGTTCGCASAVPGRRCGLDTSMLQLSTFATWRPAQPATGATPRTRR
jgi:hypothetical protein